MALYTEHIARRLQEAVLERRVGQLEIAFTGGSCPYCRFRKPEIILGNRLGHGFSNPEQGLAWYEACREDPLCDPEDMSKMPERTMRFLD